MNASELIRDSFQEIGVVAAEQPIDGEKTQTAIRFLNRLMASKDHLGLDYTEVTSASDEITTPESTWEWMEKALAIRLAPRWGQLDSYTLIKEDEEVAYSTVLLVSQGITPPSFSGNVPLGSGNRRPGNWVGKYYRENDDGILTETNQEITVEDET